MSFQKCPICEGTGNNPYITLGYKLEYPCPTCNGARIISKLTGKPPVIDQPRQNHSSDNSTQTLTKDWVDLSYRNFYELKDYPTQTTAQDDSKI
jgi:hypothetical protein